MRINRFIGMCLVGLGLGGHTALAQQFTNLNFESAAFPSILPAGYSAPASQALPGWTATPDGVYRNLDLPRGPYISVADISLRAPGDSWWGAQGNFYVSMKAGTSPASISQTGYLSPTTRSLRFRVWANLTDFTVSFAGQDLSPVIESSNPYTVCTADVSRFAGTTGELKFMVSTTGPFGSPLVTLDDISFVTVPDPSPTGTRLAIAKAGETGLRLSFPARPGTTYSVQSTTNLSSWTTVATFQATNGIMEYSDVANYPTRTFYRVIGPAP